MEFKESEFRDLIRKYNDELRQFKQKSAPTVEAVASTDLGKQTPSLPSSETSPFPFSQEYNLPNIPQGISKSGQTTGLDATGSLLVRVFTTNQISPLKNATVLVSFEDESGEKLIKSATTNQSGETPVFTLPTVPFDDSQMPSQSPPYATYEVRVSADGFFTIDSINVPIFAGESSTLPVEMLPLPENYTGSIVLNSINSGAVNLQ